MILAERGRLVQGSRGILTNLEAIATNQRGIGTNPRVYRNKPGKNTYIHNINNDKSTTPALHALW